MPWHETDFSFPFRPLLILFNSWMPFYCLQTSERRSKNYGRPVLDGWRIGFFAWLGIVRASNNSHTTSLRRKLAYRMLLFQQCLIMPSTSNQKVLLQRHSISQASTSKSSNALTLIESKSKGIDVHAKGNFYSQMNARGILTKTSTGFSTCSCRMSTLEFILPNSRGFAHY